VLLWDYEMRAERSLLESMEPDKRLALAVSVIEWTVSTMVPPIANREVSSYLAAGLRACRGAVETGGSRGILPAELYDSYDDVEEIAEEPGTSHMLSALMACCDISDSLSTDALFGVLSYCYEGSLDRENIPVWTLDAERQNPRCAAVISFQKELIESMSR
jgi:hypothetical protein